MSVAVSTTPTFSFGTPKALFSAQNYIGRFTLSPDDSRFLMVRRLDGVNRERITIVENWMQDLNRQSRR
jgi:hypothetical protein